MDELFNRIAGDLAGRLDGPLKFRFVLQPVMAMIFAIRDGRKDAQTGRPPYFWSILTGSEQRRSLLGECWTAMKKVFILAIIMDLAYQVIVFRKVYPGETLVVAFFLAFVPYVLLRGPISRLLRKKTPAH